MKTQVSKKHYEREYDTPLRFMSYHTQIKLAEKENPKNVLEIGIGNKLVSDYLKRKGIKVTTCDFDATLKPDVVADARKLPFKDDSFDLILCSQVLEHIPFEDFEKAMGEIARVTKRAAIISLPYSSICWDFLFRFPYIRKIFRKEFFRICFSMPMFFKKFDFDGQHYWEMGRKGYSCKKIKKVIEKYFYVSKETSPPLYRYHHFFVLDKKNGLLG